MSAAYRPMGGPRVLRILAVVIFLSASLELLAGMTFLRLRGCKLRVDPCVPIHIQYGLMWPCFFSLILVGLVFLLAARLVELHQAKALRSERGASV